MERIPMCNKCVNAITEENTDGSALILIGCKESEHIHNYFDAKGNCPLLKIEKFDVTEFISKIHLMNAEEAMEAIFNATIEKKLNLVVFRTLLYKLTSKYDW